MHTESGYFQFMKNPLCFVWGIMSAHDANSGAFRIMSPLSKEPRERHPNYSCGSSPETEPISPIQDAMAPENTPTEEQYKYKYLEVDEERKQLHKKMYQYIISKKLEYRINILLRTLQRKETALREAEENIYMEIDEEAQQLTALRIELQQITTTFPLPERGKPPRPKKSLDVPGPYKSSLRNEKFPKQGKFKALRFKNDLDLIKEESISDSGCAPPKDVEQFEMTPLVKKTEDFKKHIREPAHDFSVGKSVKELEIIDLQKTTARIPSKSPGSIEATSNETLSSEPKADTTKKPTTTKLKKWFQAIFHSRRLEATH